MSHDQTARQNHNIKVGNKSFRNVIKFKYLGMTVTNQNCVQEEIKSRLNSGNGCYHAVQSILSSQVLSKNTKTVMYKTVFCTDVELGLSHKGKNTD
jgi:hypothetical protein